MFNINAKKPVTTVAVYFILASILAAAIMVSAKYKVISLSLSKGGGTGTSTKYKTIGSVLSGPTGSAKSALYNSEAGIITQIEVISKVLPAEDLSETHVYPNPYKPGSGGDFDTEFITFKKLTDMATIRVFNVAGELCATIEKDDTAIDYYEWDGANDAGNQLASGIYIYYITNPDGETARGKFAIIR